MMTTTTPSDPSPLYRRARQLGLYGLLSDWQAVADAPWLEELLGREETGRQQRSLERRLIASKIGRFKPMADFDYRWPKKIDRFQIDDLFSLTWLNDATNVILIGPNGVGKTMIAQNLLHQAVVRGATALFLTASELLNDLAAQDAPSSLQRRLRRYSSPTVLALDELGYLSYDNRHADLLFEIVTRRYGKKPTVITTNKAFADWNEVFPNATSVVTLVDRLVHHAEIVQLDGDSYRRKEAQERAAQKAQDRAARRRRQSSPPAALSE
jgi:DNA replication protein DnaC